MKKIAALLVLIVLIAGCTKIDIPIIETVEFKPKDDSKAITQVEHVWVQLPVRPQSFVSDSE